MLNQKQLADKLGVSQQSVSYAMSGGGTLKQETRDYIIKEARKLGYRVNGASRLFREGRTNNLALIVNGKLHTVPGLMLSGMRKALRKQEMHLTLFGAEPEDFADPDNPPRLVRELTADGFLVLYDGKGTTLSQQIEQYRIPSVWINQKQDHNAVYPDDFSIARELTRQLASRFKGHLLYVGPSSDHPSIEAHYSVKDRQEGFLHAVDEAGRTGEVIVSNQLDEGIDNIVNGILQRKRKRPKVIITYSVEDAQTFYLHAASLGMRIPEDFVVYCFTWQASSVGRRHIPHVLVPVHLCGRRSVEMLLKRIDNPGRKTRSVAVSDFLLYEAPPEQ